MYLKISWTKVRKSFGLPKVYRAGTIIKNFYYHLQRFGKRPTGAPEIGSSETGGKPLRLAAEPHRHRHRSHLPPMRTYEKRIPFFRESFLSADTGLHPFEFPIGLFAGFGGGLGGLCLLPGDLARGTFLFAGDASGFTEFLLRIVAGILQRFTCLAAGLREGLSGNRYPRASRR